MITADIQTDQSTPDPTSIRPRLHMIWTMIWGCW